MSMVNPPHPGQLLLRRVLPSSGYTLLSLSETIGIDAKHLVDILDERADITPDIAKQLEEKAGLGSASHWLKMQENFTNSQTEGKHHDS